MSDKKYACRTNFKLYQTFCLVKIFLSVIACSDHGSVTARSQLNHGPGARPTKDILIEFEIR